jgi:hypothetical protein
VFGGSCLGFFVSCLPAIPVGKKSGRQVSYFLFLVCHPCREEIRQAGFLFLKIKNIKGTWETAIGQGREKAYL